MSKSVAIATAVVLSAAGYLAYRGLGTLTGDVETQAVANADRIDRLQQRAPAA